MKPLDYLLDQQKEVQLNPGKVRHPLYLGINPFVNELINFHTICEKNPNILKEINNPVFTIKDTGRTYRVINHWESLGLINNERVQSSQGWRKFSAIDIAWLAIVKALREFGLSSDKIKITKQYLEQIIASVPTLTWLEYAFCRAYGLRNRGKRDTYLLVFHEGDAIIVSSGELKVTKMLSQLPDSYITIYLNSLFSNAFTLSKMSQTPENSFELSEEEVKILSEIRSSGADKVTVKLKNGKVSLIEKIFEGKKDDFKSLHELIGGINHGEATLKIENGKVTYIQALEKEKLSGKK